jgi:predicted DNA-binding transcriptional regulator AlpA
MRVYGGAPGEAMAPSLAEAVSELRSLILERFEALQFELAKLLSGAVGPGVGPREIEVGPGPGRHIQIVELQRRLGRGRTTIREWYTAKRFPAPHYCGALRCWYLREIEAWEEAHRPKAGLGT